MSDTAVFNGVLISWQHMAWHVQMLRPSDMTLVAQHRFFGFSEFDHGENLRDRPVQHAANPSGAPYGIPAGKYTPPFPKVTFFTTAADADVTAPYTSFMEALKQAAPDQRSYGDVPMNWLLQINAPRLKVKYEWLGVYLTNEGRPWAEGPDALKTQFAFTCMRYMVNGGTLFNSEQGIYT